MKLNYKKKKKIVRRESRAFMHRLIGEMTFIDRARFIFTGRYDKALAKTVKKVREEFVK